MTAVLLEGPLDNVCDWLLQRVAVLGRHLVDKRNYFVDLTIVSLSHVERLLLGAFDVLDQLVAEVVHGVLVDPFVELHYLLASLFLFLAIEVFSLITHILLTEQKVLFLLGVRHDKALEGGALACDFGGTCLHELDRLGDANCALGLFRLCGLSRGGCCRARVFVRNLPTSGPLNLPA